MIEIKLAKKETEIESIRTFRNSLLMDHGQFGNDSIQKIYDPIDSTAWIFYSLENKRLTGVCRTSCLKNFLDEDFLFWEEFEIKTWLELLSREEISYTDKLMIGFSKKKQKTLISLLKKNYELLLAEGIKINIVCPEESRQTYYEWLGYKKFAPSFYKEKHSSWPLVPMVLFTEDLEYLNSIKSPLIKNLELNPISENLEYLNKIKNSFQKFLKEHTAYMRLRHLAREYGIFFKHPSMKPFISALKLVKFNPGDYVFKKGEKASSLYLIVQGSGRIEESHNEKYQTGAFLGLDQLLSPGFRTYSLVAESELETLELFSEDFYSIIKSQPKSVALVFNLIGEKLRGIR
jgi:hypothetical protein